jgi:predicted TIM-barrel fold metal-dependent hydrolase
MLPRMPRKLQFRPEQEFRIRVSLARMVRYAYFWNRSPVLLCFTTALLAIASSGRKSLGQSIPLIDYHQHLRDPIYKTPGKHGSVTASDLIGLLNAAGIKRGVVLSTAYGPVAGPSDTEAERVRAENDWTAKQIKMFPARLIGFCGLNPMRDFALAELDRCSAIPELRYGIKLHFGNSDTDLDDAVKVTRLQAIFAAANRHHMAIAIHMRPSISHQRPYGAREAEIFLNQILPAAPDVIVQIAHLAGPGGFDSQSDEALQVFINAINRHDTRMKNVYFDISGVAGVGDWRDHKDAIVQRIRQIGIRKILWGSDGAFGGGMTPVEALAAFHELPLKSNEVHSILANVAPYIR